MRLSNGLALVCGFLFTAGCATQIPLPTAPLGSERQYPAHEQASAVEESFSGRFADEDKLDTPREATSRKHVADRPKQTARTAAASSPALAAGEPVEKEEWERELERKINNICRGC